MNIESIVEFWRGEQTKDSKGRWLHRQDRTVMEDGAHSFNLDHPVSPYIGDVLNARIIILGANAGYSPILTPTEFPDAAAVKSYLSRVDEPADADWSFVSRYYDKTNYGHFVASGQVVVVNACAYRSPRLSEEKSNQAMIRHLPSALFTRQWLMEAVLPLAARGERLVINNRGGQWRLGEAAKAPGVVKDPCPASPYITGEALHAMNRYAGA